MTGGKDFGAPLVIQRVNPGSLAAKCGIQEGDAIVRIGPTPADGLRHKDAQQKILDAGNSLELALERPLHQGQESSVPWASPSSSYRPPPAQPSFSPQPVAWQPPVPTGPRKMRVGKAGEARSLPAAVGGVRIPVCSSCGIAIRGPFVSALDKSWCPDHFICANPNCRVPLVNCGFVEEAGQLFCERDYEQYFAPRCGKCGHAIIGEVVNALKNTFHMGCFICCHCHQPIGTGSFHNEDGKIYCPKDWAAMFQTKCYGCQFPIEPGDRWVEALNQNWHSECFNCSTCQVNLEGQSFFAKGGKPYCKKHSAGGRF
jgi:hypothetical protein